MSVESPVSGVHCDRIAASCRLVYLQPLSHICCKELTELGGRIFDTQHRQFPLVVLEEAVLRTALITMKDVKKTK